MSGPALLAVEQGCQSVKLGKLFLEWVTVVHREGHILPQGLLAMSRAVPPGRMGAGGAGLCWGCFVAVPFGKGFESQLYPVLGYLLPACEAHPQSPLMPKTCRAEQGRGSAGHSRSRTGRAHALGRNCVPRASYCPVKMLLSGVSQALRLLL